MEEVMCPWLKNETSARGSAAHPFFGTYIYGGWIDGPYIIHTDGKKL